MFYKLRCVNIKILTDEKLYLFQCMQLGSLVIMHITLTAQLQILRNGYFHGKARFSFTNYSSIFRLTDKTKQFVHMSGGCGRVPPTNAFTRIYGSENNNSMQCSTALRAAVESIIRTGSARTNSQYGKPNWLWTATIPAPMQIGYINRYMSLLSYGEAYASFARCGGGALILQDAARQYARRTPM